MKQSAKDIFVAFTSGFEGCIPWMYVDVDDWVTVADGDLIEPVEAALGLPFVHKSDMATPATREEIATEWQLVKDFPGAPHGGYRMLEHVTQLRLTADGIASVVSGRLALNESILRTHFPDYDTWPADVQLAVNSMAWACGANFNHIFPRLAAALNAGDFAQAALECHMNDSHNAGLVKRNVANKQLFANGARVVAEGLDPDELLYVVGR